MTIDKAQLRALAWYTEDYLTDRSATTYSAAMAARWLSKGWPVNPLFDDRQVDNLLAEIDKLRAELAGLRTGYEAQNQVIAELRKDAERYRWLRDKAHAADWEFIGGQTPDAGEAEIDAAMVKEASHG